MLFSFSRDVEGYYTDIFDQPQTVPMSTYLVAFAVGELVYLESNFRNISVCRLRHHITWSFWLQTFLNHLVWSILLTVVIEISTKYMMEFRSGHKQYDHVGGFHQSLIQINETHLHTHFESAVNHLHQRFHVSFECSLVPKSVLFLCMKLAGSPLEQSWRAFLWLKRLIVYCIYLIQDMYLCWV